MTVARTLALASALCASLASPVAAQHEGHHAPGAAGESAPLAVVVSGVVLGTQGSPLHGAVVRLVHGAGAAKHVLATVATDEAGRFTLRSASGSYRLEIDYLGQAIHAREVTVSAAPLSLGALELDVRPMTLLPMTATAARDAIALRSGSATVHVPGSVAAGGTTVDLLRTVPGLDVDADGRLSLRGNSGVLVLLDGRRTVLSGDALAAFLRQLPAAAVERVEVASGSSARLGADAASGVVNLVLRRDATRRARSHSLATSFGADGAWMGAATASRDGGDGAGWSLTYAASGTRPETALRTQRQNHLAGDLPFDTDQASQTGERHLLHSVLAGATLRPTPNASLAVRGMLSWMQGTARTRSTYRYENAAGDTDASGTANRMDHRIPSGELGATATFGLGRARVTSDIRASVLDEDVRGDYLDTEGGYRYMTTAMVARQRELVLKHDVGLQAAGIAWDGGLESRLRQIEATHLTTHFDASGAQRYEAQQGVHAAYVTARRTLGAVQADAGLRVEADRVDATALHPAADDALRAFPSVAATWTDAEGGRVARVAYGRRIQRPSAEMLYPFVMGAEDVDARLGNALLVPEVTEQVEMGLERHHARFTLQVTPFLRWTRNAIRQVKVATERGSTTTTLENLARLRTIGADGSLQFRPLDGTAITLAGTLARLESADSAWSARGTLATARLTVETRVTRHTTAQLYAYRRSAQAVEQGVILPTNTLELAMTRQVAGDRGRVTLRVVDPFRSDQLAFRVADAQFAQASSRRVARPLLSLFASYAVGGGPRDGTPQRTEGPARIF